MSGFPSSACDDVDVGVGQRQDLLLDEGLAVGVLDEVLDGLVEDRAGAEVALEDRARRLARTEAGDPRPAREAADGVIDGAAEAFGGSSISSWIVESGPGVLVICIAEPVYGGGRSEGRGGTRRPRGRS